MAGWGPDYPDPMTFLDLFITNAGHNSTGYSNPEYDNLIKSGKSGDLMKVENSKKRLESLAEAEKVLLGDDQVIIPIFQRGAVSLRNPALRNFVVHTTGVDRIYKFMYFER